MIGKISGQYGIDSVNAKKSRRGTSTDGMFSGSRDGFDFDPFALELMRINAELKNVSDVREDVVQDFKARIDSGEYVPPLDKTANALIMAGFLNAQQGL